jgi:hypothetical protein
MNLPRYEYNACFYVSVYLFFFLLGHNKSLGLLLQKTDLHNLKHLLRHHLVTAKNGYKEWAFVSVGREPGALRCGRGQQGARGVHGHHQAQVRRFQMSSFLFKTQI